MSTEVTKVLTLRDHLRHAYDHYTHGPRKHWSPDMMAHALKASPELLTEAKAKLGDLQRLLKIGRRCYISQTHARALQDALSKIS